ncbi:MAG TPA: ABC transporter substrate-binding protein [Vicinamibacterales bacterium]|nr:ABC transporter substrate-binding protein [Vicinamibacterales bacterium]
MTTIESASVFLAAQGARDAHVDLVSGGIPVLLDGGVDAATNSETQALIRSVARPDLRIVMTVAECAYRIVARKSSGIKTIADLRGKRIGTPLNTSSAYYLAKVLERAKLKESDVTIVAVAVPDMAGAIKRGAVDAVSGWEPGAQDSITALGADAIAFQPPGLYRELFDLNTTTAVLDDPVRRKALVAAVRAMIAASTEARVKPAGVWPLVSPRINVPAATISATWNHFRFNAWIPDDALNVLVAEEPWVARQQKRAPRTRVQLQALIDRSLLAEARR